MKGFKTEGKKRLPDTQTRMALVGHLLTLMEQGYRVKNLQKGKSLTRVTRMKVIRGRNIKRLKSSTGV